MPANTIRIEQARAEGDAIEHIMRSLAANNGEHPVCPACGLRIKSKAHFDQRAVALKRTWVEMPRGYFVEQFIEVDEHRTARLMELARASMTSLQSLAAKFSK